ncbi:MAG: EAL domain-containing protein, partial [Pseudomonadota bacterium]
HDLTDLKSEIVTATQKADPQGRGVEVKAASMGLDPTEVEDEDSARALIYTIKEFADNAEAEITVENLTSNLTGRVKEATKQIAQVKSAIADKSFQIAYQPIVALEDGHWHHHEALVRVKTDTLNMAPFEFIKFAEDTGVIVDFDMAMCGEVMSAVTTAMEDGPVISVAVNISGRSLGSNAFVDTLRDMLSTKPELKGNLLFEITESARIKDLEGANNFIQKLRHAGYPVCMDDFGAGEAAFEYLRALDVDYVKIDGSYVDFAQKEEKGKPFLRAMARLCHDLGIDTIAERIEDQEMVDFLRGCGVEYGQGYYYGKPSPEASLKLPPKPKPKPKKVEEAPNEDEFEDWTTMSPDQIKKLPPQKLEALKKKRLAQLAAEKKAKEEAVKGTERSWS